MVILDTNLNVRKERPLNILELQLEGYYRRNLNSISRIGAIFQSAPGTASGQYL